jgi:hypothetical protein
VILERAHATWSLSRHSRTRQGRPSLVDEVHGGVTDQLFPSWPSGNSQHPILPVLIRDDVGRPIKVVVNSESEVQGRYGMRQPAPTFSATADELDEFAALMRRPTGSFRTPSFRRDTSQRTSRESRRSKRRSIAIR